VEIPGLLETGSLRKVDRRYSFNDACQWFIDHADLILLVYDYAKLDIGPETEAVLDQLKGRETQVDSSPSYLSLSFFQINKTAAALSLTSASRCMLNFRKSLYN
jgi:hypothetical protein